LYHKKAIEINYSTIGVDWNTLKHLKIHENIVKIYENNSECNWIYANIIKLHWSTCNTTKVPLKLIALSLKLIALSLKLIAIPHWDTIYTLKYI
jgi:hypothetical protein